MMWRHEVEETESGSTLINLFANEDSEDHYMSVVVIPDDGDKRPVCVQISTNGGGCMDAWLTHDAAVDLLKALANKIMRTKT